MDYFTDANTQGRVRYRQLVASAIGVLEAPGNHASIGMAFHAGRSADGLALWRLKVQGADVQGEFIIVDGQFIRIEPARG